VCAALALSLTSTAVAATASDTARVARWREDLRFTVRSLRSIHPKPFFKIPEARFDSAASSLDARIPGLTDPENAVALMQLVAMIGDGHTGLYATLPALGFDRMVPVRLYAFEDGLFIQSADERYAPFVGAKVVRIGALPAREALNRAGTLTSADNEFTLLNRAPLFLMLPRALQVLGISETTERIRFDVETAHGRERFEAATSPMPAGPPDWYFDGEGVPVASFRTMRDGARAPVPLHLRVPQKAYWMEYLPEKKLLYVQFRRVQFEDGVETFSRFCERMFAFVDSARVENLVLDIRHNSGGNNLILKPLIHGLVKRDSSVNRPGHLFTIIGRGTFSAAMNCANFLEDHTHTLFVGEPTGAPPNHYGDARSVMLPHCGALLRVSQWAWQARLPWDDRPWIAPHLAASMTSTHYRANRDPALEAIFDYLGQPTLAQRLRERVLAGGYAAASAAYREYKRRHPDRWGHTTEGEVNETGYALLRDGRKEAALAVLRINAEAYPRSANVWDSLAEAHLELGEREQAIALYRKALVIDPGSRSARIMLERLAKP